MEFKRIEGTFSPDNFKTLNESGSALLRKAKSGASDKFELRKNIPLMVDTSSPEYQEKLMKVSQEFAGLYIYEIFKKMYNTIPRSGLIPETLGERWFREMLLHQYAMKAAKTDLKGLSELIYKSLGGKVRPDYNQRNRLESLRLLSTLTSMGNLGVPPVQQKDEAGK